MAKLRRSVSRPSRRWPKPQHRRFDRRPVPPSRNRHPCPRGGRPEAARRKDAGQAEETAAPRPVARTAPPAPARPIPKAKPKTSAPPPRRSTYADAVVLYERASTRSRRSATGNRPKRCGA